ncbi:MAG: hypothetical protein WC532_00085 [Candidatus Omnitrophota bacterium]
MGPMGLMFMLKTMGLAAFISTVLLLAVSFFVLVTARKAEEQWLKVFGYVVAILLWISAAIVFSGVMSAMASKKCPRSPMKMQGMMKDRKFMKMREKMPEAPMPAQPEPGE